MHSNDPHHPQIKLSISGNVTERADISTKIVRLTGTAGQEVKETVIISPSEENPFEVTGIEADSGENIRYDLSEVKQPDGLVYHLTIYNTKPENGWYVDKVFVKTTSKLTPEFEISVLGVIREPKK